MKKKDIIDIIEKEKIVAIVRLNDVSRIDEIVQSLVSGGIKTIEITSNTPSYLNEIKKIKSLYPEILIGAGTVVSSKIAKKAIDAGAQFLVTPNYNLKIIKHAHRNNIPVLMGALTPTEINLAIENGADFIKIFPAGAMGLDYFKAIRAPFNKAKFIPVGGIDIQNIQDWFSAGAVGVGLGSNLVQPLKKNEDAKLIENTARKLVTLINQL
ncbi:2-dehydro-3-deoxyphosphogluconate aldolase/(4S)-4-hydroxy-2-oxoglutarate aldolase [Saonia flava]|uniref:2-dehydro-3-deoxyphosphogluconate aldolase/(4S)-4-hydroxy-2-oxoglutarate aldolase n=1 Tax=Saonia flava TaxID=523696 RepID=A0A846R1Z0_9FLAO|nr:bifunctional 4-hydroxy-2-oxoglutarate aldolase/2-dehydro-3-deoxy-phosphogluconate aldolase [Saonia flava]NJB71945.1 2-dehydro-3-deoxyphosphogluconate aldolase/(4S)-4-hydroxy-2-oxoglutarate aldolase [Saonia flava]